MSPAEWTLLVVGAASAGFVQGLSGFGFSLVSMSFWAWGLMPQQAAVLATIGGLIGQVLAAFGARRRVDWAAVWPFLAGGFCGLPLGFVLLGQVDVTGFRVFVGALLALWCPLMLFGSHLPRVPGGRVADAAAGAIGGLMGPLGGFTGAVPTLWCTLRGMQRDAQREVIQNFNLAMLGATTVVYAQQGLVTSADLPAIAVVALSLLVPTLVGMRVYHAISPQAFRNVVLGLLTASGVVMLAAALPQLF